MKIRNKMSPRHLPLFLSALAFSFALSACGSGWSVFSTSSSSSSSAEPFTIVDRTPAVLNDSEPLDYIEFTFNRNVDPATVITGVSNGTPTTDAVLLFDADPGPDPDPTESILTSQMVKDIVVVDAKVRIELKMPLGLLKSYYVRFVEGAILDTSGRPFVADSQEWNFQVRDGRMEPEVLVSFLQGFGGLEYLSDLSSATVIEGREPISNDFIIGVSVAPPNGGFAVPEILVRTTEETNQNGLSIAPDGKVMISWQQGKPFCSGTTETGLERGYLFASESTDNGASWSPTPIQLDRFVTFNSGAFTFHFGGAAAATQNHLSWPIQTSYNDLGDTVAAWWGWYDKVPTLNVPHFGRYDVFAPVAATRTGGVWNRAHLIKVPVPPPSTQHYGWPLLANSPDDSVVYAVFAEAAERADLYDAQNQNHIFQYWLATYDPANGVTEFASKPIWGLQGKLPRPADFAVAENGLGVITAASPDLDFPPDGLPDAGPRAFVIDLDGAALVHDVTWTDPGGRTVAPAPIAPPDNCSETNQTRSVVKPQFPRALALRSVSAGGMDKVLVSWFDKTLTGAVIVQELDTALGTFATPVEVIPAQPQGSANSVLGPNLVIDGAGAITAVWSIWDDSSGLQSAAVFGARAAPGTLNFEEMACEDPFGFPISCQADPSLVATRSFSLSEPGRCGRFHSFGTHPSGRVLIGWSEEQCPQQSGTSLQALASLFRSFE
jgi:hypothetical protein